MRMSISVAEIKMEDTFIQAAINDLDVIKSGYTKVFEVRTTVNTWCVHQRSLDRLSDFFACRTFCRLIISISRQKQAAKPIKAHPSPSLP